jgi:uncharacterized protein (DUF697 family)
MKTFTRATLALTLSTAIALTSGCASMDTASTKVGGIFGSSNSTTQAGEGGAVIGCGAGALVSHFVLGRSALLGCAAGGAVGAVTSIAIHKHLLAEAQKTKADVEQTKGVTATLTTKSVAAKNDTTGKTEQTAALDRLTIDLPASKVKAHAADIGRVIDKASALADQASEPTTLTVEGPAAQRAWIDARVHADLKAGSSVKVVDEPADETALVISPVPAVAGAK